MYSELFRIPYQWHGVPIFGVGVLLAILAVATAAVLIGYARKQGWTGELLSSLPMLLLVGAAIVFLPRVFPEGLPVRGYGVMLLLAIVSGVGMAVYRGRQGGLSADTILSLAIWMVICGVLGARLFYVIEYWDEKFSGRGLQQTIFAILNVPEGGLVVFGGLIGAAAGFIWFVRKERLPLLAMADLVAPCMAIGLALGRIGCLLNGCCYGGTCDLPWAITFPRYSSPSEASKPEDLRRYSPPYSDQASSGAFHGFALESRDDKQVVVSRVEPDSLAAKSGLKAGDVMVAVDTVKINSVAAARSLIFQDSVAGRAMQLELRDGRRVEIAAAPIPQRSRPVHPAQIYAAIDAALLAWLLWAYFPMRRRDGQCIALLLTIHPITRFLLEIVRTDESAVFNTGLSISQNVSILLFILGLGLWWYLSRQPAGVAWPLVKEGSPAALRRRPNAGGELPSAAAKVGPNGVIAAKSERTKKPTRKA